MPQSNDAWCHTKARFLLVAVEYVSRIIWFPHGMAFTIEFGTSWHLPVCKNDLKSSLRCVHFRGPWLILLTNLSRTRRSTTKQTRVILAFIAFVLITPTSVPVHWFEEKNDNPFIFSMIPRLLEVCLWDLQDQRPVTAWKVSSQSAGRPGRCRNRWD